MENLEIISNLPSSDEAVNSDICKADNACAPLSAATSTADSSGTPKKAHAGDDVNTSNPLIYSESVSSGDKVQGSPHGDDSDMKDEEISNTQVVINGNDSAAVTPIAGNGHVMGQSASAISSELATFTDSSDFKLSLAQSGSADGGSHGDAKVDKKRKANDSLTPSTSVAEITNDDDSEF